MSLQSDPDVPSPSEMSIPLEDDEEEEEEEIRRNVLLLPTQTAQPTLYRDRSQEDRPPSPAPSYESMKSEVTYEDRLRDSSEDLFPGDTRQEFGFTLERPDSPGSSGHSAESDESMECPSKPFWTGPRPPKQDGVKRSTRWVPLDKTEVQVLMGITEQRHPAMNMLFMTKALQATLEKLVEGQLRYFKRCLVDRYSQIFEKSLLDLDIPDIVDKMLERCDMEASLKITILILTDMKLKEITTFLEGMCKRNEVQYELKASMKRKYTCIFEGLAKQGSSTVFKKIYTELFITEGGNAGINTQHEVQKIENMVKTQHRRDVVMKCREIFDPEAGHKRFQRNVLMKGVAGIGKSACVQRFILDWAEGERHQDVYFVFPLPFQELNLMEAGQYSLMQLLHSFFPEMRKLEKIECCDDYKILFICDGLDECRLSLDFRRNESWCDVTQPTRLDMLLTNLIRGNLLPSALLWITSRAKASNRIPPDCVHQVVEVRGFNDAQKEEYFRKRLVDENLANRIITHLQSTKALQIMCHIPMFCWTASDILQTAFRRTDGEIPKSLTQMFTHFLLVQLNTKVRKYQRKELNHMLEEEKEFLMKIGKLAFRMLEKDQLILNEEEWKESGISFEEGVVQSGLCTELFKEEFVMYHEKVSCFIHLYIQEYLAALFVLLSFKNSNRNVLDQPLRKLSRIFKEPTLFDLHKSAVDIALQNSSGRFDIFLRFLLGLSVESNQELLRGILTPVGGSGPLEKTAQYIRKKIKENHFPQRRENLTFCLIELEA